MKHVELYETTRNGIPTFRLISPDPLMNEFFDGWAYQLAKVRKFKTVKAYSYASAAMLNYIYQVGINHGELTPFLLSEALDCYESYLVFGSESDSLIASDAAKLLGSKNLSGSSVGLHLTGCNNFISASEALRDGLLQMQSNGYVTDKTVSMVPLFVEKFADAPRKVSAAIKANSWLAGCIAGGVKRIRKQRLTPTSKAPTMAYTDSFGGDNKVFPIDKCIALIDSSKCLRDKVLWSFLAASGCRISEALTVLMDDIAINTENPSLNRVYIVDPDTRREVLIKYISEETLNKIDHKGRDKPDTFLIEPFASIFWINLSLYHEEQIAKEKNRHRPVLHPFLFRNLRNGRPIACSYQSVWERFNMAALHVTGASYGFHSLRHMYAYYLVNHCPNPRDPKRFGLDLKMVQQFMGHRSIKSTERYARKDAKMVEATFAAINMLRMDGSNYSTANVQLQHLQYELERIANILGERS